MSVPYQRISNATVADIQFYDPAAERRAAALNVDWGPYFKVGSQEWLYKMEFGWWQNYCDTVIVLLFKSASSVNKSAHSVFLGSMYAPAGVQN